MAATSTSSSLIPPHYLANTSLALSTFILANNAYGALNPRTTLSMLGFSASSTISSADQTLLEGITTMFCTTRVCLALSTFAMWSQAGGAAREGCFRAMGWATLAGTLMAVGDGFVSKRVSGKGEWGHWGAVPISLGVGLGLIGLF